MKLAIIGGGSWGTALAVVLAPRAEQVNLWVHEEDIALRMQKSRENDVYLPGFNLPQNIVVGSDLATALHGVDIVLGVMPSRHVRRLYTEMLPYLTPSMLLVSATKGLEQHSLLRMSQVMGEVVVGKLPIAVLSGPTFAREVARGDPTAVVIAAQDPAVAQTVQNAFSGPCLRLYTNPDPIGVEIGAALKNVIAIGAGIVHGLGLGSNTQAALVTRGLAEITRLAVAMGGQPATLAGLAGMGDLVLTCSGGLSRNRKVGVELADGRSLADIVGPMRMVAEGVETCGAAVELGERAGVDLPITQQMQAVMSGSRTPRDAIRDLMERQLKGE
ncbi:MAG: NAD(P)H-dependent glycerol-3-phosphate dehydrogenase [Acidobacteriota bacterium]